jgi:hypothetical protein
MTKAAANKPIPVSALAYRPRDYFGRYDLQAKLLSTVKGRARRALIKEALETGEADTLPDFVTAPELDTFDRQMLGFFNAESEFYPCFDQILRERVLKRFINPT